MSQAIQEIFENRIEYVLSYYEGTDNPDGTVQIRVYDVETGEVVDVINAHCTLASIHDAIVYAEDYYSFKPLSDTLRDYEVIHAELSKQYADAKDRVEAERLHYQQEEKRKQAKQLLSILEGQAFADFYKGAFEAYICGDEDAMNREEVLKEIERFL